MSYRIRKNEKVSVGIRRIAGEEINAVIAHLQSVPLDSVNIHEARRHLKKVRALLQLIRKQFSATGFDKEKRAFRNVARTLAPSRNAQVLANAFDSCVEILLDQGNSVVALLRTALKKDCEQSVPRKAELTNANRLLRAGLARVRYWPLGKFNQKKVCTALKRSFRRCRKAFHTCRKWPKVSSLHEWRKTVKRLEFHLCLFERSWRKKTKATWKQINCLDACLGDDHDLAMLAERLPTFKVQSSEQRNYIQALARNVSEKRRKLQKRGIQLGEKILKQHPATFISAHLKL